MERDFGVNQALVEEQFLRWIDNPSSVPESWRRYFESMPPQQWPQLSAAGNVLAPSAVGAGAPSNGGSAAQVPIPKEVAHLAEPLPTAVQELPPTAETVMFPAEAAETRGSVPPSAEVRIATELQGRVSALVNAYRVRGHLFAELDPLGLQPKPPPDEFFLERYGLAHVDPETLFSTGDMAGPPVLPLREIVARLKETYCRTIGVEFTFLENPEARRWLLESMESTCNRIALSAEDKLRILTKLTDAETFEQFLHTNFKGAKRFSLEGAESFIPMLDLLIEQAADLGVEEVVIGMAHRGRLNVLANILQMDIREIFAGFEDKRPENHLGRGDVKYHLGYSSDRVVPSGRRVHLSLTFNPSHLEWVDPVVEGRVRSKQDRRGDVDRHRVLPLLVHGDAAFIGQGIVAETLNLSELAGYRTGGTIHVVVNNQIGFTTNPRDSRSTRYCTDITRMLRCPVFHVNGEDPEAVAQVVHLATEYRQRFHGDVVIDLYCYRKYGHNEGDEPRFTQPLMYAAVDRKKTIREVYVERLVSDGGLTVEEAERIKDARMAELEAALEETRKGAYDLVPDSLGGLWSGYFGGPEEQAPDVDTAVRRERLEQLVERIVRFPEGFRPHPKVRRLFERRRDAVLQGKPFDWGTAEWLAFASLLTEGTRVRLTGQDSRRGTFSHRHAVVYDHLDGRAYTPLQHLEEGQARFEVFDSPLSEAGVLGFEWGYSLDTPDGLVLWEAQFGDFVNTAQVIIDQFISSAEDKWKRLSGLVMLLPHGFEGQGPEHSSARLERWLALCAEDNMQVCNLTTPAQYFHALRRQMLRRWRKPLVVMAPKSLLRHPRAVSTVEDLASGRFQRLVGDTQVEPSGVRRVLLCSGKVYYDLLVAREKLGRDDVAILRFEQLYPLRTDEVLDLLAPYPAGTDLVWVQEEPWNMGAWFYVKARLGDILDDRLGKLRCIARPESASPATGSKAAHDVEQRMLVEEAFDGL